jgi:hypothetical protein
MFSVRRYFVDSFLSVRHVFLVGGRVGIVDPSTFKKTRNLAFYSISCTMPFILGHFLSFLFTPDKECDNRIEWVFQVGWRRAEEPRCKEPGGGGGGGVVSGKRERHRHLL